MEQEEIPFEDKFAEYTKIVSEPLVEVESAEIIKQEIHPRLESVFYENNSIYSFISPKIFEEDTTSTVKEIDAPYPILPDEISPASLEERIEGALFSVGRPIHTSEIIDNFEEDSPTIKRAIRKLSRKRKRTSAIVIHEISKDRWVMQLNPVYHEFFQSLEPELFLQPDERRILTEIAYRQPISIALVKKLVTGIGPIRITEICNRLEELGFVITEKRARSILYMTTSKFAKAFGFDFESRRLKLQMLWRLKRLMGDYEEEPEELEEEEIEEDREKEEEESTTEQIDETTELSSQPTDEEPTEEAISDLKDKEITADPLEDDIPAIKSLDQIKRLESEEE